MSLNPFDKQQLALQAYGSFPGFTNPGPVFAPPPAPQPQGQGCAMARIGIGVYTLTLNADSGVVDGQTWTDVTCKGLLDKNAVVDETTVLAPPSPGPNQVKIIRTFDTAGAPVDCDIEVKLFASTINPAGP